MNDSRSAQAVAVSRFRELHASGCFVIPNPWDVGTARFLEQAGFQALATTSAGVAFARGLPDDVTAISRDVMLEHVREVVASTALPVNADFQNGYAHDVDGVARNVTACVDTGVAGLSIEDNSGERDSPLYETALAVDRIRAARSAIDASKTGVLLTARCEAFLVGTPEPLRVVIDRLVKFAEAGADCLFAPGVRDPKDIAAIIAAVKPKPVNVLVSAPNPELTVARLTELGARRISVGSALSRVAWGAFMRAARGIAENGTFDSFADAASFAELNRIMTSPAKAAR